MPKLFFRRKKKQKHSVRDAITPSPAFIAVPSTPPPVKDSPTKSLRESSASPNKKLEISAPTLLPSDSNAFSNDPAVLASKQSTQQQPPVPEGEIGAASYSLVGAAEDDDQDHIESEAEPGYATVARHTGAASGSHSGVVIIGGGAEGQLERSRDDSVGADGYNHLPVEDRPRLATPRHDPQAISGQRNVDNGPHHDPRVGAELPSSKSHVHEHDRQEDFRGDEKRSLSPIARQAGELEAAIHSYDSIDNAAMLPRRNEIQPRADERHENNGGQLRLPEQQQTETLYSKVIKPKQHEDKGHDGSRSSRSPRDVVATSVSGQLPPIAPHSSPPPNYRRGKEKEKSKSPGHGYGDASSSTHRKKVSSPRDSSTPHQHQHQYRSRSHSGNSRHDADDSHHHHNINTSGSSHHHHSRDDEGAHGRNKSSSKGRSRSYSMPIEAHDSNNIVSTQSARHQQQQQHRQRSESYTYSTRPPPPTPAYYYEEGDDIDLPLEYTDQSYLGEESETVTCTESYFHDLYGELEGEGEIPGDYVDGGHVTPNRHYRTGGHRQRGSEGGHRRSRSATFPGHVEPHHQSVSKKRASSPHAAYYSSGHNRSPPLKRRKRPASSGEVPDIPFLQPPSLQPVYPIPQNQVYVFSELQPDGSVQYYSATPVNSPPVISPPPRFSVPSPLPQAPVPNNPAPPTVQLQVPPTISNIATPHSPQPTSTPAPPQQQLSFSPSATNTTPSPHKNVHVVEEEDGATAQGGGGASSTLDQPRFTRRVPMGITESGYFSSALASSQQGLAMGKASGVPPISIQQERGGGVPHNVIMTDVSPPQLGQNPNLRNDKFHDHGDHHHLQTVESPRSGRRSKSPQVSPTAKLLESSLQAANVSSHSVSSPSTKSPRGTKSRKSPRFNSSLDSNHTGAATQSLAGMAVLHEQKEKVLKARIKALEDSTVELCAENASLKQLCEALKQDASGSVEHLQRKLSSMLTENQGYREMSRDKDQKLERDQSKIVILEEELAKLKEENRHLLKAQQSADLERKEWERVSEHAQCVLDENVSLLKQQELLREQNKEIKAQHQAIVSGLSSELNKGRKEREATEKKLISLQESHTSLQTQFGQLVEESAQQVSITEHQSALKEMHSLLEELEERSDSEVKSQEAQLRILAKEKTSLVTKLTDAKAIILQLEHECTRMHKDLRVAQEKITEQKADLEAARDREIASHDRLSRAVSTAEKAMAERETYARIAKAQQKASERAGIQFALKGATAGNIQRELQMYRQEMDAKLDQANSILREKEREHRVQRRQYQREISHLQVLLKSKQARLDDVTKDKKLAEERLDLLWRASKPSERLATLSASIKPASTTTSAASGSGLRSATTATNQLQGKLSKLNSQVHPKIT